MGKDGKKCRKVCCLCTTRVALPWLLLGRGGRALLFWINDFAAQFLFRVTIICFQKLIKRWGVRDWWPIMGLIRQFWRFWRWKGKIFCWWNKKLIERSEKCIPLAGKCVEKESYFDAYRKILSYNEQSALKFVGIRHVYVYIASMDRFVQLIGFG